MLFTKSKLRLHVPPQVRFFVLFATLPFCGGFSAFCLMCLMAFYATTESNLFHSRLSLLYYFLVICRRCANAADLKHGRQFSPPRFSSAEVTSCRWNVAMFAPPSVSGVLEDVSFPGTTNTEAYQNQSVCQSTFKSQCLGSEEIQTNCCHLLKTLSQTFC